MMARDLITTDISKMFELEFKTIIMKIIAGLEKNHRRYERIPYRRTKI